MIALRSVTLLIMAVALLDSGHGRCQSEHELEWMPVEAAFEEAGETGRPVLIYVNAVWCGPCRKMEREVFPEVQSLLDRLVTAELDFDDSESSVELGGVVRSPFEWALAMGVEATPGFVVAMPNGYQIVNHTGYLEAEMFGVLLAFATSGAFEHVSFEQYADAVRSDSSRKQPE